MPRRRPDDTVKARMWAALLKAAKAHHSHPSDHGMLTLIANDAGVSRSSVWEWKKGLSYPEDDTLRKLADLYHVPWEGIAGYDAGVEEVGPPVELLDRAADVTELIIEELLPDGSTRQFMGVMRRAHELLLEGMSDAEVSYQLMREVRQKKKDEEATPSD